MKKAVNISFLILLVWQFIGVFIYFQTSRHIIKKEVASILNQKSNKKIQTLELTKLEFKQVIWQNKKEFRFQNNLYDVKKITFLNNSIRVKCYLDNKENSLLQSISSTIGTKHSKDNKTDQQSLITKILQSPILSNSDTIEMPHFNSTNHIKSFFTYSKNCFLIFLETEIKPPINRV